MKALTTMTALVLALAIIATPDTAPIEIKAEAWKAQQLCFEVIKRPWDHKEYPRHDLLIKDQAGVEVARIEYGNWRDGGNSDYKIEKRGREWLVSYPTKLGSGTAYSVYGSLRWRISQNPSGVKVEELDYSVSSSYCLSYEVVGGVEYEITSELQGTPGNYEWVEVYREA